MRSFSGECPKCQKNIHISSTDGGLRPNDPCGACWREGFHETIKEILQEAEGSVTLEALCEKLKEKGYEWEKPLNMMRVCPDYLRPILRRLPWVQKVEMVSLKEVTSTPPPEDL